MRKLIIILFAFYSSISWGKTLPNHDSVKITEKYLPNMDTVKCIQLVAYKRTLDRPFLRLFKHKNDNLLFINTKDMEIFAAMNMRLSVYAKINKLELDSFGHLSISAHMKDGSSGKIIEKDVLLTYNIGDKCFRITHKKRTYLYTDIECEFLSKKVFNIDYD